MTGKIQLSGGRLSYTTGIAIEGVYHGLMVSKMIAQEFVWEDESGMTPVWMEKLSHFPEPVDAGDSVKNSNGGDESV